MEYQLPCECGRIITVSEGSAEASVPCTCGRQVPVPSLSELRLLSPAVPDKSGSVADFQQMLVKFTPRAYVTPTIVGLNVLVFVLMAASGVHVVSPTIDNLLDWGANYGPKTANGQWWRLLTSTFVHVGFIHLLFNMWALWGTGHLVERLFGNAGFAVLYLLSGLFGSLASCFWHPMLVSAGASGAVFGVYGALLGFLARRPHAIPAEALARLRNSGLAFLGYNLFYGLTQPNIDMAAHLGGLAAGFLSGAVLSRQPGPEALVGRPVRNAFVAATGCFLVLAGILTVPAGADDVHGEMGRFSEVEERLLTAYNSLVQKAEKGEVTEEALADEVQRNILPEWHAAGERIAGMKNVIPEQKQFVAKMTEYIKAREDAWTLLVEAVRDQDVKKGAQSREKWASAEGIVRELNAKAGK
jgi:rhomboid protease GluP